MKVYEIPLIAGAQTFLITMNGGQYQLTLLWRDTSGGGWFLDIADANGNDILGGVPLVTGVDLLAQYAYLGFTVGLWVYTDANPYAVPTWDNLGSESHLYFTVEE
ncbi:hypothetical protein LU632_25975 (plasmid) [Erwinia tracheiphila]|uniref:phage baseplate plug family protein n=1 Tax=Erwinia tracheiphila TaxID=65700 RepID=UPI001F1C274F|nr:hypothetical protein [Erwinia tracheiphila]UIA94539.1 hypothetical protein LU632_25975 [Erwinia tracheiphila]